MANGHDIYIKSGSVALDYDESVYVRVPNSRVHLSHDKKIVRIRITEMTGTYSYDSGEHPEGLSCEIAILCG